MSSNKYPVQVRMREMSKQEEVLLKRKREIERKMREQEARRDNPPLPKPSVHTRPSKDVGSRREMAGDKSSEAHVKIEPGAYAAKRNKFNNDGSFLEQFKKLSKYEDVKEEKPSSSATVRASWSGAPKAWNQSQAPPHKVDPFQQSPLSPTKQSLHVKEELDCKSGLVSDGESHNTDEPDWFREALRKAQAKAKELSETSPAPAVSSSPVAAVSLSACASEEDPSNPASHMVKKRKSRWAQSQQLSPVVSESSSSAGSSAAGSSVAGNSGAGPATLSVPSSMMAMIGEGEHMEAIHGVMITRLTRNTPSLQAYALKVFGTIDLSEAQWRQCEDQMKMNVVFQLLQAKKQEAERLEQQGKVKYEYDSDEDTEGGTWEHKRRAVEMQETQARATELTSMGEGKHHIGDFLPPDELARFIEKYRAIKEGRDPDLSDYREHKLTEDNVGYRMLKSMGWTEGTGLGAEGKGITAPINQNGRSEAQGLGVERPDSLQEEDDEYDAYRKRMMLAYRFRPNPLNNPRRAYY